MAGCFPPATITASSTSGSPAGSPTGTSSAASTRPRRTVEFLQGLGLEGASVLEIGGGVGEIEIELLQAGAARAQNLELSPPTSNRHARWPRRRVSKGGSTGASTTSPRTPGGWRRPTWWSCTGWCAATRTMRACCSRGRRPCPARPGLQLSTPQPALPGLLRAVQPGDAADPKRLSGLRPPRGRDACGAGGPRASSDLPGPEPNLAGRWPGARFVGAALACVSCGHG